MNVLRVVSAGALLVGSAIYLAAETIAAAAWKSPTYSYAQNWISDLGSASKGVFQGRELDSPLHAVMNAGFIIQGLLLGLGILLLSRTMSGRSRRFTAVMAGVVTLGYVLVGTFHGSLEAQQNGTLWLHFTGATLAILGGNTLALVLGLHWRKTPGTRTLGILSIIAGVVGLVATVVLLSTFNSALPSGAIERGSVYTIALWEVLVAVTLLRRPIAASTRATASAGSVPAHA